MSRVLPILFSTDMVRAIQDGRKTVTRRLVKPHSKNACGFYVTFRKSDNAFMGVYDYDENERMFENSQTPPYQPGDILYVRETFCSAYDGEKYFYFADKNTTREERRLLDYNDVKWRPSLHMPKEAARIFLKVTDVRVERLREIANEKDGWSTVIHNIEKEGLKYEQVMEGYELLIQKFKSLWNSTINKSDLDRYGWDANPWVWVIEFERCEKPERV